MSVEWLTVRDLAAELNVPVRTVYSWNQRGVGPRRARFGNQVRYRRRDVDLWIEQRTERAA